jgi:hypothetical protein
MVGGRVSFSESQAGFGPVAVEFGAFSHARNMRRIGRPRERYPATLQNCMVDLCVVENPAAQQGALTGASRGG